MTSSHPHARRQFFVFPCLLLAAVVFIGCGEVQKMAESVSEKVKSDFKKAKEELKEATGEVETLSTDPNQNMNSPQPWGYRVGIGKSGKQKAEIGSGDACHTPFYGVRSSW